MTYHSRVQALVLVAVMLGAPASPPAIAVQWRLSPEDDRQPDATLRASVRELLAARDGRPAAAVLDQALARARVAVSHELPATLRDDRRRLRASLDEADAAYREGRFEAARGELVGVLDGLHALPELPGAAASAREAHLLRAKIAWALGEIDVAEAALADGLRIDPGAQLSVREAAPELVERYHAIQTALLASREAEWVEAQIWDRHGAGEEQTYGRPDVEIDGVPGLRSVPPGPHFIVVHRDGHEPAAAWRSLEQPWELPRGRERIPNDPDAASAIDAVCDALSLDTLLLAERRGGRVGLQALSCGVGFGPLWTGPREQLADGITLALAGPFEGSSGSLSDPWPEVVTGLPGPPDPDAGSEDRPWFRKGWIWGTGVGVAVAVAGGVVAGVLLSGREQPAASLEIDAAKFIGGL